MSNTVSDTDLTSQIMDYFSSHYLLIEDVSPAKLAFVFGQKDEQLADVAFTLLVNESVQRVLITGGIGKDSGDLEAQGLTESTYIAQALERLGANPETIWMETKATNGAENTRFSLRLLREKVGLEAMQEWSFVLVGHPASLLRLWANHTMIARKEFGRVAYCQLMPSPWADFDPMSSIHQDIVIEELVRMIRWPNNKSADGSLDPWADAVEIPPALAEDVLAWKAKKEDRLAAEK